jgi:putative chitinase
MSWQNFLDSLAHSLTPTATSAPETPKPGKVMICFVNHHLRAIDGVKYKFKYDGREFSGITTENNYCFEIQTRTVAPIKVSVWSVRSRAYKDLDDVIPVMGRASLVRKILDTAKVQARTERHPHSPAPAPRPTRPPPPTPPGPSPQARQGVETTAATNEQQAPQTQIHRAVPGEVTLAQLRQIFPSARAASDDYLQTIADEVNKDLVRFKLDTPLRKAHFFSQIKGEVGLSMKPKREGWQYSSTALMSFSRYYRNHPQEAIADAYLKDGHNKVIRPANEVAIGEKHFGKLNGNRADHPRDGSDFRGRGLLQITGYEKYSKFMAEYNNVWSDSAPDCVSNPELIVQYPYSIRSAIWFWNKYNVYAVADTGAEPAVEAVTYRVNGADMGLAERQAAFILANRAFR